ncbi:MAG: hypothetical protein R3C44_01795 [Chloroflexota bacterium]
MTSEEQTQPGVYQADPVIVDMPDDELTELVTPGTSNPSQLPVPIPEEVRAAYERLEGDPEFDAYMSIARLLVGGAVEGTAQLSKRLQKIEGELMRAQAEEPKVGEINSTSDVMRYAAVGFALSAGDGLRRRFMKLLDATDFFWEATGNTVKPFTENRITGFFTAPFERAFDSIVGRGQETVNEWVERGRREEPISRQLALETTSTIIEEFINLLSENPELAELVQSQSVGLVGEVVDEVRSRTVSADVVAETLVRRLLRRPPRSDLPAPPADVQELVAPKKTYPVRRD